MIFESVSIAWFHAIQVRLNLKVENLLDQGWPIVFHQRANFYLHITAGARTRSIYY